MIAVDIEGQSQKEYAQKLGKAFAKAEAQLTAASFFKGASISDVDIAWLPLRHRTDIIRKRTGFDFLADFPKVKAWQAR